MNTEIQFLSKTRILGYGTTQMRCVQPAHYLAQKGWRTEFGCIYRSLPKARKAIVFHRAALDSHTEQYLSYAKARGLVTIYDTDDFLFDEESIEQFPLPDSAKAYRTMMEKCDVILVSTRYLQQRAELFHPDVRVVKNGLSKEFVAKAEFVRRNGTQKQDNVITVAYLSGSKHHEDDFQLVERALIKILTDFTDTRLLVMGKLRCSDKFRCFGDRFQYKNFVPYRDFWRVFQDIDINIAPLNVRKSFTQARSELKYIEAGIFGIPTIASPTSTYRDAIFHGINGLLAEDLDWYDALKSLITDGEKRIRLGEAARKDVTENYRPEKRSVQWNELVSDILEKYGENKHSDDLKARVNYIKVLCFWLWRKLKISKRKLISKEKEQ
ncbi:MAG: glycosyltransferase family 4 protein [Desulfobacteraceae bacterium]|nr:glycosyltransferase family 4 protein [Desulfobacteraceae bacterium]MBC2757650.1 glycosyltransferase family 4 protein [Desulfobacteraceae bacterium]MBC2763895.1 glycosyltransferase family 4 protein [ANME-2 cluster archaeon]